MPRHPPCALNSLTTNIQSSWILVQQADSRSLPSRPHGSAPTWPKSSSEDAIYTTTVLPKIKRRPSPAASPFTGAAKCNSRTRECQQAEQVIFFFCFDSATSGDRCLSAVRMHDLSCLPPVILRNVACLATVQRTFSVRGLRMPPCRAALAVSDRDSKSPSEGAYHVDGQALAIW